MDSKLAQLFILVRLKKFKTSAKYKTKWVKEKFYLNYYYNKIS